MCDVFVMYFNARFSIALAALDLTGLKIDNLDGSSIPTKIVVTSRSCRTHDSLHHN